MDKCCYNNCKLYSNPITISIMIKVENISKSFDQIKVVDNISTVFDKGKTNLIIGQ